MTQMIGPYPVSGVIGAGGFGTVYAGTDPATGEPVAVKVLDWPDQDWRRAMFRHEATALLAIDHPNVVRVRDVIDQPGLAALVTDLVDGASLRTVVKNAGPLTGPQALAVLTGALDGLAAVHAAGLVHADLKPENILIDRTGTSRLIDFGLASPPGPLAGPDSWIGTPAYMAPERVLGTFQDARTDLYSTAVVLFELLCGRVPIEGPDPLTTAHLQVTQPAPDLAAYVRDLAPDLAELTRVNLAKDPAQRHQNAPAFARSLRHAATSSYGPAWAAAGALSATVAAVLGGVPAALGILGAAPLVATNLGAAGVVGLGAAGAVGAHAAAGGAGGTGVAGAGAGGVSAAGGSSAAATTATTTATLGGAKAAIVAGAVAVAAVGGGGAAYVAVHHSHHTPAAPQVTHPALLGGYVSRDQHVDGYGTTVTETRGYLVRNDATISPIPGTLVSDSSGAGEEQLRLTTSADGRWILATRSTADYAADPTYFQSRFSLISTTDPDQRLIGTCACREPVVTPSGEVVAVSGDGRLLRFEVTDQGLRAQDPIPLDRSRLGDDAFFGLTAASDTTLYVHTNRGIESSLLSIDLASGKVATLARPADNYLDRGSLSPDGRYLAMTTSYGGTGCSAELLYVVDLTTGRGSHLQGPRGNGEAQSVTFQGDDLVVGWSHALDVTTCPRSPSRIYTTPTADLPRLSGETTAGAAWTPAAPAGVVWRSPSHDGRTLTLTSHQQYGELPGVLAVGGQRIATDAESVVATTAIAGAAAGPSPSAATTAPTVPAMLTFDPQASVDGSGAVTGLAGVAPDFTSFIEDLGRTEYQHAADGGYTSSYCNRRTTWASVQAYDPRGFARGGVGACGGYAAVWARLGGVWTEVIGTQDLWSCDDLDWAQVPSRLIAFHGKATCWDAGSGKERPYLRT